MHVTTVFKPSSRADLVKAIGECLQKAHNEGKAYDCSTGTNGAIGDWDVSAVTDMSFLFYGNKEGSHPYVKYSEHFNGDISKWDVSRVTNMNGMFAHATHFNGDISKWDVSSVTDMQGMFAYATHFKSDISKWDVSSVTNMQGMFNHAKHFNNDISKWTVSSVTTFLNMFHTAEAFNHDLNLWDVSSATSLKHMFYHAKSFSRTLCGAWATSRADKEGMFTGSRGKISSDKSECPGVLLFVVCECLLAYFDMHVQMYEHVY